MRSEHEILLDFVGLRRETLHVWIARGWIAPLREGGGYRYREIDVARIRLIEEFRSDLDIGEDAMDVILPLLDQVHSLRCELRRLADAVSAQPADVRRRIANAINGG
ncbi:MAG: chaperone modulator CbpM [Alphaproteobacteria bacterium]